MRRQILWWVIIGGVILISIGALPYIINFSSNSISKKTSNWGAFGDYFNLIINIINVIVVGILSYLVYTSQITRDAFESTYIEAAERPVIIFGVDVASNRWYAYNVGKGAALNVIIAEATATSEWLYPKKCYSLASGEKFEITWFSAANRILGIYADIFSSNHIYTSICVGDETTTEKHEIPLEWIDLVKAEAIRLTP